MRDEKNEKDGSQYQNGLFDAANVQYGQEYHRNNLKRNFETL